MTWRAPPRRTDRTVLAFCLMVFLALCAGGQTRESRRLFREAWQAIEDRQWALAADRLEQAIDHQPRAGGTVRLYGTLAVPYLPYFHLGVARGELGDCARALAAFGRSEAQGAIADYRKHAAELGSRRAACHPRAGARPDPPESQDPAPAETADADLPVDPVNTDQTLLAEAQLADTAVSDTAVSDTAVSDTAVEEPEVRVSAAREPEVAERPAAASDTDLEPKGRTATKLATAEQPRSAPTGADTSPLEPTDKPSLAIEERVQGADEALRPSGEAVSPPTTSAAASSTRIEIPEPAPDKPRRRAPADGSTSIAERSLLRRAAEALLSGRYGEVERLLEQTSNTSAMARDDAALALRGAARFSRWATGNDTDSTLLDDAGKDLCALRALGTIDITSIEAFSPRLRTFARALTCPER